MPALSHRVTASSLDADDTKCDDALLAVGEQVYKESLTAPGDVYMGAGMIEPVGDSLAHENMPPFLVMNWCIALTGIFPANP